MLSKQAAKIKSFNPDKDQRNKGRSITTYHYTSPSGLHDILKEHHIRFTDCQFLNDKSEYVHIWKPLRKALEDIGDDLFDDEIPAMIDNMFNDNYETEKLVVERSSDISTQLQFRFLKHRYYIFCTTELQDSLNMWNYYVKGGNYQGYNFGLTVNSILKSFSFLKNENVELLYGKVMYKESEQIQYLENGIQSIDLDLNQKLKKIKSQGARDTLYKDELYASAKEKILSFLEIARLFFKDEAFAGESEYRFVIKLPLDYTEKDNSLLNAGYNVKEGIIVPHCTLKLDKSAIHSITLSPMLETRLAENGLKRFLADNGYPDNISINQSKIPIRY
ncbi:DUF2971 domain-containing protein [Clostridium aminobutyricum]|uniref:DUF2971 domain-containing protein n=1 Tax=Clostridium aminobutyricum TaxID=33953 RepID=A0A939D6V3_CLOAM|nr:DUF2971 domain-containing protein [Clostridium aminobutyricum]MBN7772192.1 DUF2971 domain-containing protein [Clostridium aminobutyricum]